MTKTYHHYVDGKKVAIYKISNTNKPKRHAVEHYRHTQRVKAIKSLAATVALATLFTLLVAAIVVGLVDIN